MTHPCSPLAISHCLYRATPLDTCVVLATRDGVTALLWVGAVAMGWRTLREKLPPRREKWAHEKNGPPLKFASSNGEFATFVWLLCMMGATLWAELLLLGLTNFAVYIVVDKTADICAWGFGNHHPYREAARTTKPIPHPPNDPVNAVRITLPWRRDGIRVN